ncbi:MAG: hypothetical protein H0U77_02880 [Nocardioidaceae bacterium]|nr:hypothetical protein [Nocardioidaceae bacterium]
MSQQLPDSARIQWQYREAGVEGRGEDDPSILRESWYEMLNRLGAQGWELVTEHVSLNTDVTSYHGTLKLRHDTDD